jgi:hypothetical protein
MPGAAPAANVTYDANGQPIYNQQPVYNGAQAIPQVPNQLNSVNQGNTGLRQIPSPEASEGGSASEDRRQAGSRRVLLIEDSSDAREMLRMMLELAGHEVFSAADGVRGLELRTRLAQFRRRVLGRLCAFGFFDGLSGRIDLRGRLRRRSTSSREQRSAGDGSQQPSGAQMPPWRRVTVF